MTREDAIEVLKKIASYEDILEYFENHSVTVQDTCYMAIKALKQEPKMGHWINSNIPNEKYVCSECGGACWYYDYQANVAKSKFCPNCGARMF